MKTTVSAVLPDEKGQWKELYYAYAEFYRVPMDEAILERVWSWIHDQNQAFYCLVAKDADGSLLGLMHFRAMPSPLRGAQVGFLDDLFVSASARGQGVVEALFGQLKLEAKVQGWPIVRWITADNNYRARALYDKLAEKTQWNTYQMPVT